MPVSFGEVPGQEVAYHGDALDLVRAGSGVPWIGWRGFPNVKGTGAVGCLTKAHLPTARQSAFPSLAGLAPRSPRDGGSGQAP